MKIRRLFRTVGTVAAIVVVVAGGIATASGPAAAADPLDPTAAGIAPKVLADICPTMGGTFHDDRRSLPSKEITGAYRCVLTDGTVICQISQACGSVDLIRETWPLGTSCKIGNGTYAKYGNGLWSCELVEGTVWVLCDDRSGSCDLGWIASDLPTR